MTTKTLYRLASLFLIIGLVSQRFIHTSDLGDFIRGACIGLSIGLNLMLIRMNRTRCAR